jgi:hypothetical protein
MGSFSSMAIAAARAFSGSIPEDVAAGQNRHQTRLLAHFELCDRLSDCYSVKGWTENENAKPEEDANAVLSNHACDGRSDLL